MSKTRDPRFRKENKFFLYEGSTWEDSNSWWKHSDAKQLKTVQKHLKEVMNDPSWQPPRKFGIVKGSSGRGAGILLREAVRTKIRRTRDKDFRLLMGGTKEDMKRRRKLDRELYGKILKIQEKK